MKDYIALRVDVDPCNTDTTDLLADYLAEIGYESFESDESGLTAFIQADDFDESAVRECLYDFPIQCDFSLMPTFVEGKDWNEEWEKNYFQPIVIDDQCVIHSTFHREVPVCKYDIVIDPKMAFGTGHHATTEMMVRYLLALPLEGKRVIDMGTGTGILAILASKRGAKEAVGVEIDGDACENARENVALNSAGNVEIVHGDSAALEGIEPADLFIANINRNIILADLKRYADALKSSGTMLLSGFYVQDIPMVERAAATYGLTLREQKSIPDRNAPGEEWTAIRLEKE